MKMIEEQFELGLTGAPLIGLIGEIGQTKADIGSGGSISQPGIHVSDILRDIENRVMYGGKRGNADTWSEEEKKRMGNYAAVGLVWEYLLERVLGEMTFGGKEKYERPGVLVLDGITGRPDWVDREEWVLEEFKATWRSSRKAGDEESMSKFFWYWVAQTKAYCKMINTLEARIRVLWVNGDYRDSGPQTKSYRISFTEREVEENWRMIRNHAATMRKWARAPQEQGRKLHRVGKKC